MPSWESNFVSVAWQTDSLTWAAHVHSNLNFKSLDPSKNVLSIRAMGVDR